jgi:hypothetical protein
MTSPLASTETCRFWEMLSKQPEALEEANVALKPSNMATTVRYQRRAAVQFLGSSMSFSEKVTWPSASREGLFMYVRFLLLYGLCAGRDDKRARRFGPSICMLGVNAICTEDCSVHLSMCQEKRMTVYFFDKIGHKQCGRILTRTSQLYGGLSGSSDQTSIHGSV